MEIEKIFEIKFDSENSIVCCEMLNEKEAIILMSNGNIVSWNFRDRSGEYLFSAVIDNTSYIDGGFDMASACKLYVLGEIIVAVNEFKAHGYVYNRQLKRKTHIRRELYHAQHSSYPIALFLDAQNNPHIIYAVAWNHLQIMNLETMQILTADKSLIEVDAEDSHREFYSKHTNDNNLPWPGEYDYFFAQLTLSHDNKCFLSRGWSWGSYDDYNIYDLQHFISNRRILDKSVCGGEHYNRSACWVGNDTIAVAKNEGMEDGIKDSPTSLYFYHIMEEDFEPSKIFELDVFDGCCGEMHYNTALNSLIIFNAKKGLTVCSVIGEILLRDAEAKIHSFNEEHNLLVSLQDGGAFVYRLS